MLTGRLTPAVRRLGWAAGHYPMVSLNQLVGDLTPTVVLSYPMTGSISRLGHASGAGQKRRELAAPQFHFKGRDVPESGGEYRPGQIDVG